MPSQTDDERAGAPWAQLHRSLQLAGRDTSKAASRAHLLVIWRVSWVSSWARPHAWAEPACVISARPEYSPAVPTYSASRSGSGWPFGRPA